MSRTHNIYGYIEWDAPPGPEAPAERRPEDKLRLEDIFDYEARRRFGELIARAAAKDTKK
ncbi:MAG TPA: hypothetical protein VFA53_03500 [Xanthobacteraceae bacterium]|nr:hypothetical protein [Xanthobacteraceae bacterium]